jgi:hypothetical protein
VGRGEAEADGISSLLALREMRSREESLAGDSVIVVGGGGGGVAMSSLLSTIAGGWVFFMLCT